MPRWRGADASTFGRRGDADYSLWLNDSSATSGYAATSTAAVNTQDSFTVSTWASLTDSTENRVVLTEPGEDGSGFTLYYSSTYKKWIFNRTDKDRNDPTYIRSFANAQNPPLKVWTHLPRAPSHGRIRWACLPQRPGPHRICRSRTTPAASTDERRAPTTRAPGSVRDSISPRRTSSASTAVATTMDRTTRSRRGAGTSTTSRTPTTTP
ncbi:LamG domain-containing protein [Streptomyces sp. DASNCL29]|nr:LamG domain-containing protein [Streptomyces sp. DASNCL29]